MSSSQRFEQIPGVGAITIVGGVYREIQVQLRRDRLRAAGLTGDDVAAALRTRERPACRAATSGPASTISTCARGASTRDLDEIGSTVVSTSEAGVPDPRARRGRRRRRLRGRGEPRRGERRPGRSGCASRSRAAPTPSPSSIASARRSRAINAERDDLHVTVDRDQSEFIRESMANVRIVGAVRRPAGGGRPLRLPAQRRQHRHHRAGHPHLDHRGVRRAVLRRADAEPDDLRRPRARHRA